MRASLGGESTNPPIGQAATLAALQDHRGVLAVVQLAGVVAKVELPAVAAKVRFAHVVISADDAALEDREEVFGGVAVLEATGSDILLGAVVHDAVPSEFAAHSGVDRRFVGHQV